MPKRMRLQNFDYGDPGPYFVTICLDDQWHLFGTVDEESVSLNMIGSMIEREWLDLERRYIGLQLDAYAIMPNHFHGILLLPVDDTFQPVVSLVEVIGAFKSLTTVAYGRGVSSHGWPTSTAVDVCRDKPRHLRDSQSNPPLHLHVVGAEALAVRG